MAKKANSKCLSKYMLLIMILEERKNDEDDGRQKRQRKAQNDDAPEYVGYAGHAQIENGIFQAFVW